MAESLEDIIKNFKKQLEVLETPKSREALESIEQSLKDMKNIGKKKRKGGLVSRKRGGKIMQGYKAGGKV